MTIRLEYGIPTSHSGLIARFAIGKGLFARAGMEIEPRVVYGGPELAAAYDSGAIKFGEMGSPPALTQIARGLRFRVIGSSMRRGVALFLVTHPDIRSLQDLKGRTLGALSIGSCSDWYLREILAQNGLDPAKDLTIRPLGADHGRIIDLIGSGEIAAALVSGLNAAIGEARGVLRSWGPPFGLADLPQLQWSVHVANQDFLSQNPDLVDAILGILVEAGAHAEANPDEWIDFTAAVFDIDRAVAERVLSAERPFLHFHARLDMEGLKRAIELQRHLGAIDREIGVDEVIAPCAVR